MLCEQLLLRVTQDHPHHSLPVILALAHGNKDAEILQARSSKKAAGRLSRSSASQDSQGEEPEVGVTFRDIFRT